MTPNHTTQPGGVVDLRAMRRSAGLSQQRVAELAHCSLAAVALFEKGYRPSESTVLPRIITAINEETCAAGNETSSESSAREGGHDGSYPA